MLLGILSLDVGRAQAMTSFVVLCIGSLPFTLASFSRGSIEYLIIELLLYTCNDFFLSCINNASSEFVILGNSCPGPFCSLLDTCHTRKLLLVTYPLPSLHERIERRLIVNQGVVAAD